MSKVNIKKNIDNVKDNNNSVVVSIFEIKKLGYKSILIYIFLSVLFTYNFFRKIQETNPMQDDISIQYLFSTMLIFANIMLWPVIYIISAHLYHNVFYNHVVPIIEWKDKDEYNELYHSSAKKMFRFYKGSFLLFVIILIFLFWILCQVDLYNGSGKELINSIILKKLAVFPLLIGAPAGNILYYALSTAIKISNKKIKSTYYKDGFMHYIEIKNFCFSTIAITSIICFLLYTGMYISPCNKFVTTGAIFDIGIWILLIFLSAWPLFTFIITSIGLNVIKKMLKSNILNSFNEIIDRQLSGITTSEQHKIESIQKMMVFREYLVTRNIGEKNIINNIQLILTVIFSLSQIILLLLNGNIN